MSDHNSAEADAAWLAYRDEQARLRPWCDQRRLGRQMRKRDFIAGYLAGRASSTTGGAS